jgi:hypothetical protein
VRQAVAAAYGSPAATGLQLCRLGRAPSAGVRALIGALSDDHAGFDVIYQAATLEERAAAAAGQLAQSARTRPRSIWDADVGELRAVARVYDEWPCGTSRSARIGGSAT